MSAFKPYARQEPQVIPQVRRSVWKLSGAGADRRATHVPCTKISTNDGTALDRDLNLGTLDNRIKAILSDYEGRRQ